MHNAYFSSALVSLKSKGSLSFSFNDCSSLLNERFNRDPVSSSGSFCSCCCCCCCHCHCACTSHNRVPTSPGFLYGLRQSTLIQCSPSRRLILGGGDRYLFRAPFYDLNGGVYEVSCSIKGRNDRSFDRRRKGRSRCMVSQERNEGYWLGGVDDAEAVISLLSEEVSEEYLGGRERNERLPKRVEVKKREDLGSEFYRGKKNNVEVEKRRNYGGESSRGRKRNGESNLLESDSKYELESSKVELREEGFRRNEEGEDIMRREKHRGRNRSSSCSSYYSFQSSGEYGSDEEVQDKQRYLVEESLSGFRKDSSRNEQDTFKAQVEELNRYNNDVEGHDEGRHTATGSHVEWDCRKKSEKKLSEVSVQETESKKESSEIHLSKTHETDYGKALFSHKQFDDLNEKLSVAVSLDKGTRKQYNQINSQDKRKSELRSKWQEVTEIENIHDSDVETTSQTQKRFNGRGENLRRDELRTNSQQFTKMPEDLDVDTEKVSNSRWHSDSRMNIRQGHTTMVQSSFQGRKEQYEQESERISGLINLRKKSESFSGISETCGTNSKTSTIQTETIMKNQEENSRLASISLPETKDKHSWTDNEYRQSTQSRKGSQNITSISVHASDKKTFIESHRTSERIINQERVITSEVKPTGETRERCDQTEGTEQTKSRKEVQKATGLSHSHEKSSGESSSLVASLNLVSQAKVQQIDMEKERNSLVMLTPPSSQLVARGSPHVDLTVEIANQEISGKSSDSGSVPLYTRSEAGTSTVLNESYVKGRQGETYNQPLNITTHEDALGSAHRLEESSMRFVGEFMEKARHEASTSEFQKEKNVSLSEEVSTGEKQWIKDSGQYGSEDFQLKVRESRGSSEGSGGKGPSDEMWHVTDASVQPPQAETPEGNEVAGNAIVKRRGRTLWNVMADIVRLRWGSHTETPNSAARSDIKSSSNESVSSEAWFSGRESDKNSDDNVKRERRSIPQEATASQQLQLGKTFTQSQGEASDRLGSKNKETQLESDMTSSSSIMGAGSTSKGVSSTFQINPPGLEVVPLSLLSTAQSTRRSVVEEISETGETNESRTSSMARLGQPFSSKLTEVSGSPPKDGELKQRKLQRNKQVLKDRFEEWEEAYKLENEQRKIDEMFMREALLEAKKAADTWEVPVGAILVQNGKIIARGCNLVEELRDSTAHAEMICIREASNVLRTWRLAETTLYVTLEPCPMCAGAILQARISTLVWGAPNKLLGADGSWVRLFPSGEGGDGSEASDKPAAPVHPFHPKMTIRRGILASECAEVMQQFFQLRRRKKEKNADPPLPPSCLPITNHPSKLLDKMQHMFHIMFCL